MSEPAHVPLTEAEVAELEQWTRDYNVMDVESREPTLRLIADWRKMTADLRRVTGGLLGFVNEWAVPFDGTPAYCVSCGQWKQNGHAPDCARAALASAAKMGIAP